MTSTATAPPPAAARVALGALALLVPLAGLALLLARPSLDVRWEHHPAHFWLVLATAGLSATLAYATGEAAARRGDARVLHVSSALLACAGFLGLHALATPGVLLATPNAGFAVATPVGVALGSLFALRSTLTRSGPAAVQEVRLGRRLRLLLVLVMAGWGAVSLSGLPPLDRLPTEVEALPLLLAVPGIVLYAVAAGRFVALWRRHRTPLLVTVPAALLLLAQSLLAMALARSWHLSWWHWHVLLLLAFALVAVAARRSWHEERFADLYLPDTSSGQREVSVLFADLQGFTTFSEAHPAAEVTEMLNAFLAAAVPTVTAHGGEVDRLIGDAVMATFNKRGDQPDHAARAARAALALQEATSVVAADHPSWPAFRVGVNTGPVTVSVLGSHGGRTHTVIGDTVNIASRIEGLAPGGGVAVGAPTLAAVPGAVATPLGPLAVKGRAEPVEVFLLHGTGLADAAP